MEHTNIPFIAYEGAMSRFERINSEISHAIDEVIHSARDRRLLKRRLIDGICYEPLAEEFDLSVRQVKQIVYKAQDKLFAYLP